MCVTTELEKTDIDSVVSAVLCHDNIECLDFVTGKGTVFPITVYPIIRLWNKVWDWFGELPDSESMESVLTRFWQHTQETGHLPDNFLALTKRLNKANAGLRLVLARRREDEKNILFYEEVSRITDEKVDRLLEYLETMMTKEENA